MFVIFAEKLLPIFLDKIDIVRRERAKIIQYAEKKTFGSTTLAQSMPGSPHQTGVLDDKRAASAMLEMVGTGNRT